MKYTKDYNQNSSLPVPLTLTLRRILRLCAHNRAFPIILELTRETRHSWGIGLTYKTRNFSRVSVNFVLSKSFDGIFWMEPSLIMLLDRRFIVVTTNYEGKTVALGAGGYLVVIRTCSKYLKDRYMGKKYVAASYRKRVKNGLAEITANRNTEFSCTMPCS